MQYLEVFGLELEKMEFEERSEDWKKGIQKLREDICFNNQKQEQIRIGNRKNQFESNFEAQMKKIVKEHLLDQFPAIQIEFEVSSKNIYSYDAELQLENGKNVVLEFDGSSHFFSNSDGHEQGKTLLKYHIYDK